MKFISKFLWVGLMVYPNKIKKTLLLFSVILICLSCGQSKNQELLQSMDQIVSIIESSLKIAERNAESLDNVTEVLLLLSDNYNLDISSMDEAKGGNYRFFNNTQYYKYKNDGKAAIATSGFVTVNDEIKKKMMLLENAQTEMIKTKKLTPFSAQSWIMTGDPIALTYPYKDLISGIKPKFNMRQMYWWNMISEKNNPDKKIMWSPEPYGSLVGNGWIIMAISPIYTEKGFIGGASVDIKIKELADSVISNKDEILILVSKKSLVISKSLGATIFSDIREVGLIYYLDQLSNHPVTNEEYRLSNDKNPPEIRKLAENIQSTKPFNFEYKEKIFKCYSRKLKGPDLYLLGFIEE